MDIWVSPASPSPVLSSTASSSSFSFTKHSSAAMANDIDVREGERVSVYISQPVPCRYEFCHALASGLILKLLMAKRLAIMMLKPGAREDWAMKPSLSSARQITSSPCFQSHEGMFSRYALLWYCISWMMILLSAQ